MDKILELLENNAKLTPDEIAAQLNLDTKQVEEKIKYYEKENIILGYKTIINKDKANGGPEGVTALIEVSVTPERDVGFDNVASRIYKFDEVVNCTLISGSYDLLVEVVGESLQQVAKFVSEKLSPIENVNKTTTHFILKKYKIDGHIMKEQKIDKRLAISPW